MSWGAVNMRPIVTWRRSTRGQDGASHAPSLYLVTFVGRAGQQRPVVRQVDSRRDSPIVSPVTRHPGSLGEGDY